MESAVSFRTAQNFVIQPITGLVPFSQQFLKGLKSFTLIRSDEVYLIVELWLGNLKGNRRIILPPWSVASPNN